MRVIGRSEEGADGLHREGASLTVGVMPVPRSRARSARIASRTVRMQIDTGAQVTLVDERVRRRLGLRPSDMVTIVGPTRVPQVVRAGRARLLIRMSDETSGLSEAVQVETLLLALPPRTDESQPEGFLGRDVLRFFEFRYVGPDGTFELRRP
jgi:hypothetical protein